MKFLPGEEFLPGWEPLIYTVHRITFFRQKRTLYLLETNNFKCTEVDSIIKLIFHQFSH